MPADRELDILPASLPTLQLFYTVSHDHIYGLCGLLKSGEAERHMEQQMKMPRSFKRELALRFASACLEVSRSLSAERS